MDIELVDVFASYGEKDVLKHINLNIKAGSFVGIVGPSGSGKSTLATLLSGELLPSRGKIFYQRQSNPDKKTLNQLVTVVDATPWLFKETIRDHLKMANFDTDDESMWRVLEKVKLVEMLQKRQGLDTVIEENAQNFSGGERQRLAIARALLKKSYVYIFDEATSNVDSESEAIILKVIQSLKKEATVLFITHRLSATLTCDMICVLDKGLLVEEDSPNKLLERKSLYAKMFEEQSVYEDYQRKKCQNEDIFVSEA